MEIYGVYFAVLMSLVIAQWYYRHRHNGKSEQYDMEKETLVVPSIEARRGVSNFKRDYFSAYGLVVAADWLQGPYVYSIYRQERGLSEGTVAALFSTSFIAAAGSAAFVGSLADQYGRRKGCLVFCLLYSISCLSVLSARLEVLFIGRAIGGLGVTLLYAVFETWMVTEYTERGLSQAISLGSIFSFSITLSGIIAIFSGIAGETLVTWTRTETTPFIAAVACLALAAVLISRNWNENYGQSGSGCTSIWEGLQAMVKNKNIMRLTLTSCVFEGSLHIFIFFWSQAMIVSRIEAGEETMPPFGLVFSCLMCAMMNGGNAFSTMHPGQVGYRQAVQMMLVVLALASSAFILPTRIMQEKATFWSFCLFEFAVGLYWPTMSTLRTLVVEDAVRARVYGLMRMPLNLLVVVALSFTQGDEGHRNTIFSVAGVMLVVNCLLLTRSVNR
ncbi:DUF791-domain-containing protein [Polychaeton citri CBS 116435]|uniref:Molybdate-anion transporter n=1 Tax=Polychaeton citri CBS 116435 TaxID=1314669 RepID=A0A9P4UR42_9PEZI|nr:DUF791-domain-containing protein [Polychaeton citri CBS 116435]